MRLNLEQIRSIARGAVRVQEIDGEFWFFRFTEAQVKAYSDAGKTDFYKKTFATAGVRLALHTDSRRLCLGYRVNQGSSRAFFGFDVYVNGHMLSHFGADGPEIFDGHATVALPEGEKLVEVYFPWSMRTTLFDVELDDGATLTPAYRKQQMICFGDSITHGYDAHYPSLSYATTLARLLDADMINKGIGGDVFFEELLQEPDPISPDIITVAYGTNDWCSRSYASLQKHCSAFYERLSALYPQAKIYAISPICRMDGQRTTPYGAPADAVVNMMRKACRALPNVTVLDGWSFVPAQKAFFSDFYLHPNDIGFACYAQNLYRAITDSKQK